jgi:hypothetical protein
MASTSDFVLERHGSILLLLRPISDAGGNWIDEHIGSKYGVQPYHPIVVIEPQYIEHVLKSIRESGLKVR